MYPHRIRLRGPWQCEPLARDTPGPLPAPLRMTIPCRWADGGLGNFAGRARFTRNFGYPGRLDWHEHVWLTFAGVDEAAEVWVNGQYLGRHAGAPQPFEFDVTGFLRDRNTLQVDVESRTGSGGIWGEVALEVRRPAFLRDVRVRADRSGAILTIEATGTVAGISERPVEVALVLGDEVLARAPVEPTAEGRPFRLTAGCVPARLLSAAKTRIDLLCGSTVWHRTEEINVTPCSSGA